jgi:hypothetical protein
MKPLHVVFLLLINTVCFGNDIDLLHTNHDVNKFLEKKVNKRFKQHPPLDDHADPAGAAKDGRNNFFKIDIDGNGYTDLIIYGYEDLLVVNDGGKGSYWVNYLNTGTFSLNKATLISIDSTTLPRKIVIRQGKSSDKRSDTLVSLFHGFIEYNSHPAKDLSFEKITLKTSQCFGTCPVFELSINKDRTAAYHAIMYNDETGKFKGTIPMGKFNELMDLLRYLQLDKLNDSYKVDWTDDQTATTEIKYNGISKTISDYGEIGTFGLVILYSKFFALRTSVEWVEL